MPANAGMLKQGFQQSNWAEQFSPRAQESPGGHLKRSTSKIQELCLLLVKHGKGVSGFPVSWGESFGLLTEDEIMDVGKNSNGVYGTSEA